MSILAIPSCAALVILVLVVAIAMVALGDLSLITPTDLRVNWAPEPNVPYMGDPTRLIEPKNVKPVKPSVKPVAPIRRGIFAPPAHVLVEEVVIPLEVESISLRQRLFGRPEAVYFV